MENWSIVGLISVLIISAFFSSVNFALRDYFRRRLEEILIAKKREKDLEYIQAQHSQLLLVTAVIRTAANLALVLFIVKIIGNGNQFTWTEFAQTFLLSLLLLSLFTVAIPHACAKYAAEPFLATIIPILKICEYLFRPILTIMKGVDLFIMRLAGASREEEKENIQEELLEAVHEGEEEGIVDAQERKMIESVMEMRNITVGQIMTPRTEIIAIEITDPLDQIKAIAIESGYSRMPVYEENLDNIVGMLYVKDLLKFIGNNQKENFDLRKIMRKCYFVPETKPVRDLFREFRAKKLHIAVVLDEYGGTLGLITLEDVIEQIVGQIADEYEPPEKPLIKQIDSRTLEVDGRMRIDEINDEYKLNLPESEDYETVAGFLFSALGRIPKPGESFNYKNLLFTITDATDRKINKVRVEILPEELTEQKQLSLNE